MSSSHWGMWSSIQEQVRAVGPHTRIRLTKPGEQTFHVYRTQAAVDRSSHPPPPPSARPEMSYKYVGSMIDPHYEPKEDWAQTGRKLSRGHLSWYRAITPPTECVAFRARVDHKGVPGKERAVLATAGEEGVYLWDLDEPDRVESIPIKPQNQAKIQVSPIFVRRSV